MYYYRVNQGGFDTSVNQTPPPNLCTKVMTQLCSGLLSPRFTSAMV